MQLDLSEKEIETILGCSLFVILHIDQYDNFYKAKQLKNNSEKLYAQLKKTAEKDHKNEN